MSRDTSDSHEAIAATFGTDLDPLAKHADGFKELDEEHDPFELYLDDVIRSSNYSSGYIANVESIVRQWRSYMQGIGRHPACPAVEHVFSYVEAQLDQGQKTNTIRDKLNTLSRIYKYWQRQPAFPHGMEMDEVARGLPNGFNPFEIVKSKAALEPERVKPPHPLSVEELRRLVLDNITAVRDRAIVLTQLKLGLRASELCNLRIPEVHLSNQTVLRCYEEMGTHSRIKDIEDAVYVPHDRENNKSACPRILPVDDELRKCIVDYMFARPDNGEPWLFISKKDAMKLDRRDINRIWKKHALPKYAETDDYRRMTSHFGRHYFTTWFAVKKDWSRPKVKYLRGDTQSSSDSKANEAGSRETIDWYIHTTYEDVERRFRDDIFKLRI